MSAPAFDLQPELAGPRLALRPLKPEDLEALYEAASDPLIWEQHPFHDRWKRDVFEEFFAEALRSKGAFAVLDRASGRVAGSSRYYDLDLAKGEVAIGFTFLRRAYWGGSHNRELKTLMLDHAFRFVPRVIFHVDESNLRSRGAMAKIGGVLTGKMEKPRPGGPPRSVLVYTISR